MASPNMFPTPKVEAEHNRAHTYESLPKLHHEVCHLLGSNPDSDDEEPPPTYHVLFGDENDVHAYRPIGGQFTVEYHRNASQVGDDILRVFIRAEPVVVKSFASNIIEVKNLSECNHLSRGVGVGDTPTDFIRGCIGRGPDPLPFHVLNSKIGTLSHTFP